MTHTIEVRGLRVLAVLGALDAERERPQPLRVDLDLDVEAERRDEVSATVDYGPVLELAAETISRSAPRLLETACDEVARAVLEADRRIAAVTVTVTKLRPPVAADVATVGVRRRVAR